MAKNKTNNSRALRSVLTARWNNELSIAQRAAWNLAAQSVTQRDERGEYVKICGFNLFLHSNM